MEINLVPVSEEEAAATPAAPVAPAIQLQPVDPLDDFEAYNALEDEREAIGYDPDAAGPAAQVWNGVKGIIGEIPAALKGVGTLLKSGPMGQASPEAVALLSASGGKMLGNYNLIGQGAKTLTLKAVNATGAGQVTKDRDEEEIKKVSRKASWDFAREVRDTERFTNNFNQHLETIFPEALKGLGAVPVDQAQASGLSMALDPSNYVPAGAAAKWTTQVPMRGAVRAAESAAKEAALDLAKATAAREAANLMLKPGLNAAERAPLFNKAVAAGKALEEAKARQVQALKALSSTAAAQRAVVDQLATEAASSPLITRAAAVGARGAGAAAELAGKGLQKVAALPEALASRVAGGADEAARKAIEDGTRNLVGAFGVIPAGAGVLGTAASRLGRSLNTYGRLLAEAEGQLPFFKRLARETDGLTSWGASLVDQSGMGELIVPTARTFADASRGLPFAAGLGYVSSGGDKDAALQGAGGGLAFGLAGGAYGQWRRFGSAAAMRQRQLGDVARFKSTLPTEQARVHFDAMPAADRIGVATMQLAHPDLQVKFEKLGPGRSSFHYVAEDGPVAVINLDTKDAVRAVAAHEIGHHIEKHGLTPAVERVMFGDPLLKRPGLYTQLDKQGNPVLGPDGRYETNAIWARLKENYNTRLKAEGDRTGETLMPRDNAGIAKEIFAEHAAGYMLGDELAKDLRSNAPLRALGALADSSLVGSMPQLRQMLGKLGVPLDARGKRVQGSDLFPGGLAASKELRALIRGYSRKSASGRVPELVDEPGGVKYTQAEVIQHPQILDTLFDGSDDVVRDRLGKVLRNKDGSPRFATSKEQQVQRAALAKELGAELEAAARQPAPAAADGAAAPAEPRPQARLEQVKEGGKTTEGWVTPFIPEEILARLEKSGKYNPAQIAHLREVSNLVKNGAGQSALFFYQPAKGSGGRYKSLAGDWRTETPYAIFISKAGNVLIRTISREKLMANAQSLIGRGRGQLWENNLGRLVADVDKYLANHAAGRPGLDGIGAEKRDVINSLFGIDTNAARAANPLLESSPKSPVVIRSRRIDRTNRLTRVEEYFPTNYDKLNRNLRPEAPMDPGEGGGGAPGLSWDQVKPGMEFDQVKRFIPKAADGVPSYFLKGPPEVVNQRLKTWLEYNPVAIDADGRRIWLAAPEVRGGKDQLLNRVQHLTGRKEAGMADDRPRTYEPNRARLVPAIARTLGDYQAKLKDTRNGKDLYLRRYADGTLHLVVVDPSTRRVSGHGTVDGSLASSYSPDSDYQFGAHRLVAVRQASSP
jgi:hypothetical protein